MMKKQVFLYLSFLMALISCSNIDSNGKVNNISSVDTDAQTRINTTDSFNNNDSKGSKKQLVKNDSTKNYNSDDDIDSYVEIVESKVKFNPEFEPTLVAKIRNNLKKSVVSLELKFIPTKKLSFCEAIVFRRKVTITSGKEIQVIYKLPKEKDCYSAGNLYIDSVIFSDGTKQSESYQTL